MASISVKNSDVNLKSIHPELIFDIDFVYTSDLEILQSIQGILHAEDWREIAILSQFDNSPIRESSIKFDLAKQNNPIQSTIKINLRATLNALALQYIEQKRMENITKDVKFLFSFRLTTLQIKAPYGEDILFLETNSNGGELVIKQSDWVQRYAPKLGLGSFLLVELPDFSMDKFRDRFNNSPFEWVKNDLQAHAEKLNNALSEMKKSLIQGDFEHVMWSARRFFEVLRFQRLDSLKDNFKQIYESRNGSVVGFDDLYKTLQHFFDFTSKFIHDKAKDSGALHITPSAHQEDAYMTYSFCLSLFNFMLQKV